MKSLLELQKKLLPDMLEVMRKRYETLRHLQLMQPVGRRSLAAAMGTTERILRAEVEFLRLQGLVHVDPLGMRVTQQGAELLTEMEPLIKELFGLTELEEMLRRRLGLRRVIIVTGDADKSEWVKKEMGRAGARLLREEACPGQVVAVGGGTTVAAVAEMMASTPALKETTFVPARGGLGEAVELEANYIVSLMAKKTGGNYRLLHVPDQLSDEAYRTVIREPHVREILELLKTARMAVHGIGDAMEMAARRKSPPEVMRHLRETQAVGEAFGYYFNRRGEIVHRMKTVGIHLEDLQRMDRIISVAGGASKADAIAAICPVACRDTLITDEGAARAILESEEL